MSSGKDEVVARIRERLQGTVRRMAEGGALPEGFEEHRLPDGRRYQTGPGVAFKLIDQNTDRTLLPHEKVMDAVVKVLPSSWLPTHAKTLVETVQGKTEPLTEKDFDPDELQVMRKSVGLVEQNLRKPGAEISVRDTKKGAVRYEDYPTVRNALNTLPTDQYYTQYGRGLEKNYTLGQMVRKTPEERVYHTLGRYNYKQDEAGNIMVQDTYDYPDLRAGHAALDVPSAWEAIKRPYEAIVQYAYKVRPDTEKGRPVRVLLPTKLKSQVDQWDEFEARVRQLAKEGKPLQGPIAKRPPEAQLGMEGYYRKNPPPVQKFATTDKRLAQAAGLWDRTKAAFLGQYTMTDMAARKAAGETPEHYSAVQDYNAQGGMWPMTPAKGFAQKAAEVVGSGTRKVFTDPLGFIPARLSGGLGSVARYGGGYEALGNAADQYMRTGKVPEDIGSIVLSAGTGALGAASGELAGKLVSRATGGLGDAGVIPELLGRGYGAPLVGEGVQAGANELIDAAAAEVSRRGYARGGRIKQRSLMPATQPERGR